MPVPPAVASGGSAAARLSTSDNRAALALLDDVADRACDTVTISASSTGPMLAAGSDKPPGMSPGRSHGVCPRGWSGTGARAHRVRRLRWEPSGRSARRTGSRQRAASAHTKEAHEMAAATASMRWGAFRSIGMAVRAATRSGSPGLGERLRAVPRLVRATVRGEYRGTSRGQLALLLGAVLYVVSPVDLVPEAALTIFGLGDDALVIAWIATALVNQTEGYLTWERQRENTVQGDVIS